MGVIKKFKICGTPRTASKKKKPGQIKWEEIIEKQLREQWNQDPLNPGTKVQLNVIIKKMLESTDSNEHGPDLDNLLKPILDGIAKVMLPKSSKNSNEKGDFLVYRITVLKEIVDCDEGVEIIVENYR